MSSNNQSPGTTPTSLEPAPADPAVVYEPSPDAPPAAQDDPQPETDRPAPRRRRIGLPLMLFVLTCFSTFLAGATGYLPFVYFGEAFPFWVRFEGMIPVEVVPHPVDWMPLRRAICAHWNQGLLYMACVLAILLAHEMGHFVMTLVHRVRASLPFFIPLPISPIGTMGAVIVMDSRTANRREIFDIGLAGPIAGLVVALPIMWIGAQHLNLKPAPGELAFQAPLAMRLAIEHFHPGQYNAHVGFPLNQANAWFMAGWVGLLVTGLNMLPVSQLDGGHVTYALFGRGAHWLARAFMAIAFGYMAIMMTVFRAPPAWVLMAVLVMIMGTDHPPTSDDKAPLGWFRTALGFASLVIPVFCFIPNLQL